ncbi:MAG: ribose 5-phosphate isomerase B [Sphingobacteriales bacterium]|nr:MAG: ribose 5-phosphate isomerase B [Sphingobacteriales bacterium]
MNISIGCDHAGFEYKELLLKYLAEKNYSVKDFGTHSHASVDYPDFVHPVCKSIENGEAEFGILLCGSANGVCITANKHQTIRAALCWQDKVAMLARLHNNANIICIPARFVSIQEAESMICIFLSTNFEGGRHAARVGKISI